MRVFPRVSVCLAVFFVCPGVCLPRVSRVSVCILPCVMCVFLLFSFNHGGTKDTENRRSWNKPLEKQTSC